MKRLRGLMAGTRVDKHNERMSLESLTSMADTIRRRYIPIGVEHDPRIPPQGRVVSAEVVETPDGEHEIVGLMEVFEPGDLISYAEGGREVAINHVESERLFVMFDRSYQGVDEQRQLSEITTLVHGELREELKKAVEPVSLLTIAVAFVLGGIAKGFLEKVGEDLWETFKGRLKSLLARRAEPRQERLLSFRFTVKDDGRTVTVETILTNPSPDEIEAFLEVGLQWLDQVTSTYVKANPLMVKLVLEFDGERLRVLHGVRRDGAPLFFDSGGDAE